MLWLALVRFVCSAVHVKESVGGKAWGRGGRVVWRAVKKGHQSDQKGTWRKHFGANTLAQILWCQVGQAVTLALTY